jgi:eukaryotic-like serine/threonine-protein kinase
LSTLSPSSPESATTTLPQSSTPNTKTVEEAEHLFSLKRARSVAVIGLMAWLLTTPLDFVAASTIGGSLHVILLARGVGAVALGAAWATLTLGPQMSPRMFRVATVATHTALTAAFGVMGAQAGGLTTPYFGGVFSVMAACAVISPARWTRGAVDFAIIVLGFQGALLLAVWLSPTHAWQLSDPRARAVVFFDIVNLGSMYAVAVFGGHVAWALRRQVFEARSLGRYKLKTRIGAGGMGEVWRAYHNGLKRDVAVKILRTELVRDARAATLRFEREVRATTELSHPNTVRILDYGVTDDGLWYYVMELLAGENLAQLVAREGALPQPRAVHIIAQAARALAEAHGKGIVHRDLKPENLVLTEAGGEFDFVKVVDFGIAKLAKGEADATLTAVDGVIGTPLWLPPEGFTGKPIGPAGDVYALGAVLHLLLSGRAPFERSTLVALASAKLSEPAPPLPSDVAPDLAAVVVRCLMKSPSERYANAAELAVALSACACAGTWRPAARTIAPIHLSSTSFDVAAPTIEK